RPPSVPADGHRDTTLRTSDGGGQVLARRVRPTGRRTTGTTDDAACGGRDGPGGQGTASGAPPGRPGGGDHPPRRGDLHPGRGGAPPAVGTAHPLRAHRPAPEPRTRTAGAPLREPGGREPRPHLCAPQPP